MDCKILLRGISPEMSEDRLRDHFARYGHVVKAVISRDKLTRRPRGTGFLIFAGPAALNLLLAAKHRIDATTELRVSRASTITKCQPFSFETENRANARTTRIINNKEVLISKASKKTPPKPFSLATERRAVDQAGNTEKENSGGLTENRGKSVVLGQGGSSRRGGPSSHMVSNGGGRRNFFTAGAQNEANRVTKKGNASFSLPTMGAKNKIPTSVSSSSAGIGKAGTIVGQLPSFQKCSNQVSDLVEVAPSRGSVNDIGDIKLSAKEVVDRFLAGVANDPTIADKPIVFQEYTNQISGAVDVTLSDNSPAGEIEGVGFSSNTMPMTEAFDSSLDAIANGPTTAYQPISVQDCTIQFSGDLASTGVGYVGETKGVGSSSGIIQIAEEAVDRSLPLSSSVAVNIKTSSLDKREENLDHLITQHVVIAPHFRVTELESRGLSFGNLGASFKRRTSFPDGPVIEDSFTLRTSDLKPKLSNANASEAPANHGDVGPRKDLDIAFRRITKCHNAG